MLPEIGLGSANLLEPSLPEFIDIAARHGFGRISVRPHVFAEALKAGHTAASLRRRLADAGIAVTMIDALNNGLPGVPAPDRLAPALRATMPPDVTRPQDEASCLLAAAALGARTLNVVAYLGEVVPLDRMAEAISGICRRAHDRDILIALEFLPESGIPDLAHALRLLEACGEPNCGLTLDLFHLDRTGGGLDDLLALPPGLIAAIQISDRRPTSGVHVPFGGRLLPGEGILPLPALVAAALRNSPDATIDIEVLNAKLKRMPPDDAAHCLAAAVSIWGVEYENKARGAGHGA